MLRVLIATLIAAGLASASLPAAAGADTAAAPAAASAAAAPAEAPLPDFEVVELPALQVAYSEAPMSSDLAALFMGHMQKVMAAGIVPQDGQVWGACLGDPDELGAENVICHACSTLPDGAVIPEAIRTETIGGGLYVRIAHIGPYAGLGDTYTRGFEWLHSQQAYSFGEWPTLEHYYSDPMSTPEEELITYVYLPVTKKQ